MSSIVVIGTGGALFMVASSVAGKTFSLIGLLNAGDDLSGLVSVDEITFLQQIVGEKWGTGIKLAVSLTTSRAAIDDALSNMDDLEKLPQLLFQL